MSQWAVYTPSPSETAVRSCSGRCITVRPEFTFVLNPRVRWSSGCVGISCGQMWMWMWMKITIFLNAADFFQTLTGSLVFNVQQPVSTPLPHRPGTWLEPCGLCPLVIQPWVQLCAPSASRLVSSHLSVKPFPWSNLYSSVYDSDEARVVFQLSSLQRCLCAPDTVCFTRLLVGCRAGKWWSGEEDEGITIQIITENYKNFKRIMFNSDWSKGVA